MTDASARADLIALYAYDHELRRAVAVTSNTLLAEVRLTWWSEVLDQIYGGQPVRRHPTALALHQAVKGRGLERTPLEAALEARLVGLDGDPATVESDAAAAITEAAALCLDRAVDGAAARVLGQAWATEDLTAQARDAARRISPAAFPAVAHVTLIGRTDGPLLRRLRLTWAVARGSV